MVLKHPSSLPQSHPIPNPLHPPTSPTKESPPGEKTLRHIRTNSTSSSITLTSPSSDLPPPPLPNAPSKLSLSSILDWLLKILALASAIIFGIWAPISYRVQVSGNVSNDEVQAELVRQVGVLAEEVRRLRGEERARGRMEVWEFCERRRGAGNGMMGCEEVFKGGMEGVVRGFGFMDGEGDGDGVEKVESWLKSSMSLTSASRTTERRTVPMSRITSVPGIGAGGSTFRSEVSVTTGLVEEVSTTSIMPSSTSISDGDGVSLEGASPAGWLQEYSGHEFAPLPVVVMLVFGCVFAFVLRRALDRMFRPGKRTTRAVGSSTGEEAYQFNGADATKPVDFDW